MKTKLAPIALFVYNRPKHTQQTLKSLMNANLAEQSHLYIFADGPKSGADNNQIENIKATRKIIKEINWPGKLTIIESETNKGLANSIIEGVTKLVNEYGKIIVLEDDLITSPGFLEYMNDALTTYENEEKVMHISAYMFPLKTILPETFFYNSTSCWGWGTWKRAWKYFNKDANDLYSKLLEKTPDLNSFDYNEYFGFINQLKSNIDGKISTWAIKWHTSVFLNNGYSLHPNKSLVNNIGHDNSGENCVETNIYYWENLSEKIFVNKIEIKESIIVKNAMIEFNKINIEKRIKTISYYQRILNFIKRKFVALVRN